MTKNQRCSDCKKLLPLTAEFFHRDKTMKNGFKSRCKECVKAEYKSKKDLGILPTNLLKRNENKDMIVKIFGNACECCGESVHNSAYDFHHKDPSTKQFKIADKCGTFDKKLVIELAKCDMLCKNCHAGLHAGQIEWDPVSDTYRKIEWDPFGEVFVKKPARM